MTDGLPRTKWIHDKKYVLKIVLVVGKKDGKMKGSPSLVRIIEEKDIVHLAGGEEFYTAYFPENCFH